MKTKIYAVMCIIMCISMLVSAAAVTASVTKSRPGWASIKMFTGFIANSNISNTSITFNTTIGTFYVTFQPLTIKRYHRNECVVIGSDTVRFAIITKHFVFIIATAIFPPPGDITPPCTTITFI